MESSAMKEIQAVYKQLIVAWNNRNPNAIKILFTRDGENIGFDGNKSIGHEQILLNCKQIFEEQLTSRFVTKIKNVRLLSSNIAILTAIAGMIPPGNSDIHPKGNTHHTLVAVKNDHKWRIQLFQSTPVLYYEKPELVDQITGELKELIG